MHPEIEPLTGDETDIAVRTSFCYQFKLLARRNFLNILRLPQTSYVKLAVTVLTASFAVLLFYGSGKINNNQGMQDVQGSLFFVTMNISFNAIQNVILIFPDERPVFLREVNNNMYKSTPYFWAKIVSELPFSIFTPTIYGCIIFYAIGYNQNEVGIFFAFLGIVILIYNASSGYSLIISASFSDKQLAVTLTPVLIIPFMLFAGFFVASSSIPVYLKEFEWLSIFKYGYQALMLNNFSTVPQNMVVDEGSQNCMYNTCFVPAGKLWYSPLDVSDNPCVCPADVIQADGSCNLDNIKNWSVQAVCNPLSQIAKTNGSMPDIGVEVACLAGIYVACYLLALLVLNCLSSTYE